MSPFTPHRSIRPLKQGGVRGVWSRSAMVVAVAFLVAAMLGSSLEIHPGEGRAGDGKLVHAGGHGPALSGGGDGSVVAECHPGAPLHLDAPEVSRHPSCPACLLHSSARTARLAPSLGMAVVLSARGVLPELNLSLRRVEGHEGLSRGPPSA